MSVTDDCSDLARRSLLGCNVTERRFLLQNCGNPRHRSPGDGVMNTASMERLNATFRARLAPLARRCRALARHTLTLHEGMCLVGTVYNLCTPHASLSHVQKTTPAMAVGITDHGWTMHELLSFHVPLSRWVPPKRRGRPSRVLQRLIERWCA